LLVWASGLPHLLKLNQKERSLQPKAMITFKRPPALSDYLTNYKRITYDEHATAEDCSSAPCVHCALWGNYGKLHSTFEKEDYLCTPTGRIKLTQRLSCANYGIYMATCLLCKEKYVGQTKNKISVRWTAYRNNWHKSIEKRRVL